MGKVANRNCNSLGSHGIVADVGSDPSPLPHTTLTCACVNELVHACACMHVHMYASHVHVRACMHVHMYASHVHVRACMHAHMYESHVHACACMHAHTHVHVRACMHVHMYASHVHVRACMHVHTCHMYACYTCWYTCTCSYTCTCMFVRTLVHACLYARSYACTCMCLYAYHALMYMHVAHVRKEATLWSLVSFWLD
jgi:hypothetical protein